MSEEMGLVARPSLPRLTGEGGERLASPPSWAPPPPPHLMGGQAQMYPVLSGFQSRASKVALTLSGPRRSGDRLASPKGCWRQNCLKSPQHPAQL